MKQSTSKLNRRLFMRLAAASGASVMLPDTICVGEVRQANHIITIQTRSLKVALNESTGTPAQYLLSQKNVSLTGDNAGTPIDIRVCRRNPWSQSTLPAKVISLHHEGDNAIFDLSTAFGDTEAVRFRLRYAIAGSRLTVFLEHVLEKNGFELLEVRLPALVTVHKEQENAWMAHGDTGGAFIELTSAKAGSLAPNQFWGDTLSTLPILMTGDAKAFCVLLNASFMDGGAMSVSPDGRGMIGTVQRYRVDGSQCADLNLGKDEPLNCGNSGTPNLLVNQPSICHLDFFPVAGDWKQAWIVGAKHVREQLPPKRTAMYDDVYTYGIRLDEPSWPEPATTFAQCEEIIREVAALTGNIPQIVHLWGWQFKGKDTGYPAVNEVDSRIGGYEGMMQLMENAKKYNASVTLSDNYDDGYRSSPAWSEDVVARRPDGEHILPAPECKTFPLSMSGCYRVRHGALERVAYTCKQYKLPGTTHIDVLTYYAIRNDWDREHPASGYTNLVEGKYKILEAFHERGIDVSSEAPRYPFMGKVSFYWQGCGIRACPMGGRPIPMFPAIYRQTAVWGDGMRRGETNPGALQMFYGGGPRFMTRYGEDRSIVAEKFYLQAVPWMLLHRRNIIGFTDHGKGSHIELEGGEVEVSLETGKYSAKVNGTQIAAEDWIACPLGSDRIAFYSIAPRTLRFPTPTGWDPQRLKSVIVTAKDSKSFDILTRGGEIVVEIPARSPVIVSRG